MASNTEAKIIGIMQRCKDAGITYGRYYRLKNHGYTDEEVFAMGNKPLRRTRKRSVYGDFTFDALKEDIEKAGISLSGYIYRRRHGMTHEEALAAPKRRGGARRKPAERCALDFTYEELCKICRENNADIFWYMQKRNEGLSHGDALESAKTHEYRF